MRQHQRPIVLIRRHQVLTMLIVALVAVSGCITDETEQRQRDQLTIDDAPAIEHREDLSFPWEATGEAVVDEKFHHAGGPLTVHLQWEGAMGTVRLLEPRSCEITWVNPSVTIGAYNNMRFECQSVEPGIHELVMEFRAVAEGNVILYDVARVSEEAHDSPPVGLI